ncbi:Hsp20/alpha crystallin family protein [Actinobacteria bacterium YIM 96077]|uniref:Hsp20/alpha crystallin family protein n=1 Tax=Phytoactinopolyspora halophila TaxID=1981511 RepID=A0A329QSD1_9ACTN|nr:Hsp20/alpha crystallin family protein [Phytoactinopolyspora halophila]AYY15760.1 Hsp20/alpha crystallin family protein [Actinobacteria bacterium YIM 96077]RAW14222.1 Hsp20/alpha crystallin family protein [Phytoactinopolyspora halophila]
MGLPIRRSKNHVDNGFTRPAHQASLDPFAYLDELRQRMDSLFQGLSDDLDRWGWSTPLDIEETPDAYIVEAELPGVSHDDLTLDWNGDQLFIHGEVKERERVGFLRHKTRRTGQFNYSVTLPGTVDGDRIEASLSNGVLTIHAPKASGSTSRRIPVTAGRTTTAIGQAEDRTDTS